MNNLEFDEWLSYHCEAFPAVQEWLTDERTSQWLRALRRVRLKPAKDATIEMLADEDAQPKGFSQHPARIVKLAKAKNGLEATPGQGNRYISGELTFACDVCLDAGTVSVFLPEAMRAMRDGRFTWKHQHLTGAVACSCPIGQRLNKLTPFDARRMVLFQVPSDTAFTLGVERLAAFFNVAAPAIEVPVHVRPVAKEEERPPLPERVTSLGMALASPQSRAANPPRVMERSALDEANAAFAEAGGLPDDEIPF